MSRGDRLRALVFPPGVSTCVTGGVHQRTGKPFTLTFRTRLGPNAFNERLVRHAAPVHGSSAFGWYSTSTLLVKLAPNYAQPPDPAEWDPVVLEALRSGDCGVCMPGA